MARRSERDRRNARRAASIAASKRRHASRRLKERVGDMDFAEFREHILDGGRFDKLADQGEGAWHSHARHDGEHVYFILKHSDRGRGRGREIATVLTKPMAMHNFPHVFGSDGRHMTPAQRDAKKRQLATLAVLEQENRELWGEKIRLEEEIGRLRRQLAKAQKKPEGWFSRLFRRKRQ